MALPLASNSLPCGGLENVHNGCMEYFPRLPPNQKLCGRCRKLNEPELSNIDRSRVEKYLQCMSCGVSGQFVSNPCGTCRRNDLSDQGSNDPVRIAAAEARLNRVQKSFGPNKPPVPIYTATSSDWSIHTTSSTAQASASVPAMGPATSATDLEAAKNSALKGIWTVVYSVRRSKGTLDRMLGNGILPFPGTTPMPTILEELVKQINPAWTRCEGHSLDLLASECELRFLGNINFDQKAQTLSIKDFYHFYLARPDKHLVLSNDRKVKMAKGTFISLEVFINEALYNTRLGLQQIEGVSLTVINKNKGRKRVNQSLVSQQSSVVKRTRSGTVTAAAPGALKSMFITSIQPGSLSINQTIDITFTTITCTIDSYTGNSRMEGTTEFRHGRLDIEPMRLSANDIGRSKDIFHLTIKGAQTKYVAKRFIPSVAINNEVDMNSTYLLHELVRIKRLEMFRNLFMQQARISGIEIADFAVSEAFIITLEGSLKAGLSRDYLVEPLRATTSMIKYSGTFGTNGRTDKLSATISSFAHFIAGHTACKLVFVDLQGSMDYKPGEAQKLVLFDPMTHSPIEGNTGPGDFGILGIQDFIDTHQCSLVCKGLNLPTLSVLQVTLNSLVDEMTDAEAIGKEVPGLADNIVIETPAPAPASSSASSAFIPASDSSKPLFLPDPTSPMQKPNASTKTTKTSNNHDVSGKESVKNLAENVANGQVSGETEKNNLVDYSSDGRE